MLSRDNLLNVLQELAEWLKFHDAKPMDWVVCGGVAMSLQNLNDRTTQDVDVLGAWDATALEVVCMDEFPQVAKLCIRKVVESHPELKGFGANWLNLGPSDLTRHGLPKGHASRLKPVKFGDALTLHLLSRVDLIALKLYAAADSLSHRQEIHFQDLKTLQPSFQELDTALDWVRTRSDFDVRRPELQHALERLGRDDLAYYL